MSARQTVEQTFVCVSAASAGVNLFIGLTGEACLGWHYPFARREVGAAHSNRRYNSWVQVAHARTILSAHAQLHTRPAQTASSRTERVSSMVPWKQHRPGVPHH